MRLNALLVNAIMEGGQASVVKKSEASGWAIPLFSEPDQTSDPKWFALSLASSDLVLHAPHDCPIGLLCDEETGGKTFMTADGVILGQPVVSTTRLGKDLQYRDVYGIAGLGPNSALAQNGPVYIKPIDANSFLMKSVESDRYRNTLPVAIINNRWEFKASLVREKGGREIKLMPRDSTISFNFLSDDIEIPASNMAHFTGWRRHSSVAIKQNRLYMRCKRFDTTGGVVYEFQLKFENRKIIVPMKRSLAFPKAKGDALCASNLVFTSRGSCSIGRSVMDRYDIVLDARNVAIRFIGHDSRNRISWPNIPSFEPPRLIRYQLRQGSAAVGKGEPVGRHLEWIRTGSGAWTKQDFVVTGISMISDGILERLEIRCLLECPEIIPESWKMEWFGSPKLDYSGQGSLILFELMRGDRYELEFRQQGQNMVLYFIHKGKRFVVHNRTSRPEFMIGFAGISGPVRETREFAVKISSDLDSKKKFSSFPIIPANKDMLQLQLPPVMYGEPEQKVMDNGDIRISATNVVEGREYPIRVVDREEIQVGEPYTRFHQIRFMENLDFGFQFWPLIGDDKSENQFALSSLEDTRLVGEQGRFVFTVSAVPGTRFTSNPFTVPEQGIQWIGEPLLLFDDKSRSITIKPSGAGLEYVVMTRRDGGTAWIFFVAKQALRFTVPVGMAITDGGPLVFLPATGVPENGEFILSVAKNVATLETLANGDLQLELNSVLFHLSSDGTSGQRDYLFGGPNTGQWTGKPYIFINQDGDLVLRATPGDTQPYIFEVVTDKVNHKVRILFKHPPIHIF
jgi:hypothetical protein